MPRASDPTLAKVQQTLYSTGQDAQEYEEANVHAVYESIASHFSDTRYKPWPLIPAFLASLPPGSIGLDVGCGNGKYLATQSVLCDDKSSGILTLGVDRSSNLIDIARGNFASEPTSDGSMRVNEVCVGDALGTNHRTSGFDYAISIATIHHMSTFERRSKAVQEMIRLVRAVPRQQFEDDDLTITRSDHGPYTGLSRGVGRFLIVVWAREQRGQSRRQFESVADDIETDPADQDLLVPWILRKNSEADVDSKVFQRFYHVFTEGELEQLVDDAAKKFPGIEVRLEVNGWEKGNWFGIWRCIRR